MKTMSQVSAELRNALFAINAADERNDQAAWESACNRASNANDLLNAMYREQDVNR